MSNTIKLAVSLIFKHKNQVFYIKRQNYLHHFPGYIAFPGGKVNKEDGDFPENLMAAAYREAQEELGINISSSIEQGNMTKGRRIAIATTPDFNPYRFETHFILFETKTKMRFKVDQNEFSESGWVDPYDIIRKFNSGECLLVPPVKDIYEKLSERYSFAEVENYDLIPVNKIPSVESIKNLIQIMPLSNTLPPADRTNCFLIGDQSKILVDPSPRDTEEYRSLLDCIQNYKIDKIILTHHHGDHHQHAPELARHLKLPIYLSQDTKNRLENKHGSDYLYDCEVITISEGDILGKWIGQEIKAFEIPGHDEGHIGLAPTNMNWFIVGDLFQGIGTVVVGGDEGDMGKYFKSLQKVIELSPACVIPSHGIALGGTKILEKTLEHRILREKQVLELYQKNPDLEYILKTIYFDIPRHLYPYAMANIKAHLNKLEGEGKISLKI